MENEDGGEGKINDDEKRSKNNNVHCIDYSSSYKKKYS